MYDSFDGAEIRVTKGFKVRMKCSMNKGIYKCSVIS